MFAKCYELGSGAGAIEVGMSRHQVRARSVQYSINVPDGLLLSPHIDRATGLARFHLDRATAHPY